MSHDRRWLWKDSCLFLGNTGVVETGRSRVLTVRKRRVQSIVDYEGGSRMTASVSLLHRSQCLFKELVDFTHELRVELAHLESVYSLREGV